MRTESRLDMFARELTRRSVIKAALASGIALTLPQLRVSRARGAGGEPCYKPCVDEAKNGYKDARDACRSLASPGAAIGAITPSLYLGYAGAGATVILALANKAAIVACASNAELSFHRNMVDCGGSECGNRGKYPGGAAPQPPSNTHCPPATHVVCGEGCCSIGDNQCLVCKNGKYQCCAAGSNCCPGE